MMRNFDFDIEIIEQIADTVIVADITGAIVIWNAAAESLFGYAAAEAIGQSLDLIIPDDLRAAHWAGYRRAVASGATRKRGRVTLTRALTKSGATIYLEISFAMLADVNGKPIGSVAIARDATIRRRELKALRDRLAALEATDGARGDHSCGLDMRSL